MAQAAPDLPLWSKWAVRDDTLDELFKRIQHVWLRYKGIDGSPASRAWLGADVHHDQCAYHAGVGYRVGDCGAATHGKPHQDRASEAQRVDDSREITQVCATAVVMVAGPLAITMATLIDGDDMVLVTERQRSEIPHMSVLSASVETQHGRLVVAAPIEVMEVEALDVEEPAYRLPLNRDGCARAGSSLEERDLGF